MPSSFVAMERANQRIYRNLFEQIRRRLILLKFLLSHSGFYL